MLDVKGALAIAQAEVARAQRTPLDTLLEECRAKGIPTDVPGYDHDVRIVLGGRLALAKLWQGQETLREERKS